MLHFHLDTYTQTGYDRTQFGYIGYVLIGTRWQLHKVLVTFGHSGENKSRKFGFGIHKKKACSELQTFILGAFLLGMITNQLLYQLSYTGLEFERERFTYVSRNLGRNDYSRESVCCHPDRFRAGYHTDFRALGQYDFCKFWGRNARCTSWMFDQQGEGRPSFCRTCTLPAPLF